MKIGIVGLPVSGKTTLFNALTGSQVDTAAFLGKTEAHHAIVQVPDERFDRLNDIFKPKKSTPATIEYIDVAGLSTGEQRKKGFSDQLLGELRTVDALLVVLRAFADVNVPHPLGALDPKRDLKIVESEFILSDMSVVENRLSRLTKKMRTLKTDQDVREFSVLEKSLASLENEQSLRLVEFQPEDEFLIRGYQFLTAKPLICLLNIHEREISEEKKLIDTLAEYRNLRNTEVIAISAQIEMEIQQLSADEAELFREDLGISRSAMEKLIRTSFGLLGLISFFTVNEAELHVWTIPAFTRAPQAAGAVHSDMERGFIRAEVVHFGDFIERGSLAQCRSDGVLHVEGKDYVVKDGDLVYFRFAV
jgi:GTP-binding protein YchF